ncbi:MAG: MFS transporter, partial [Acidimicrobiales bacterium]
MSRAFGVGRRTFSALRIPNFRRYYLGQAVSLAGTWMQSIAQSWLVYTMTHSSTDLGFTVALQTLPILLLGPYGGVIADRVDKRRLMVVLQSLMGVQALVLGLLTITGIVRFWQICVLAVVLGLNNTFEN